MDPLSNHNDELSRVKVLQDSKKYQAQPHGLMNHEGLNNIFQQTHAMTHKGYSAHVHY